MALSELIIFLSKTVITLEIIIQVENWKGGKPSTRMHLMTLIKVQIIPDRDKNPKLKNVS